MNIKKPSLFAVFFLFAILTIGLVSITSTRAVTENVAESILDNSDPDSFGIPNLPGTIKDVSDTFKITDSEYLNIEVNSSEIIDAHIESIPNMILMHLESSNTTTSTDITINNLTPNTTYYWHQDTHRSSTPFTTTLTGSYTYTQDLSESHLVFIKPEPSTKYISDDATGGDCTTIGTWNSSTKTCTLTTDLTETVEIESDGITLDGNGYTLIKSGAMTGDGVYSYGHDNLTIKNFGEISNFSAGIYLYGSSNSGVNSNIISNNYQGLALVDFTFSSFGTILQGNIASLNSIGIINIGNSTLIGNIASDNEVGITISIQSGTALKNNNMFNNLFNLRIDFTGFNQGVGSNDIDITNLVDGKPVYFIEDAEDVVYDSSLNIGAFYCVRCNNITVKDLDLSSNYNSIFFWDTHKSIIENISDIDSRNGIELHHSNYNTIVVNNLDLHPTLGNGIQLFYSNGNTINDNNVSNSSYGLYLNYSDENIIFQNTFSNNGGGVVIDNFDTGSNNNAIYNNNFISNWDSIYVSNSPNNSFNKNLPIGGNYFNDFDSSGEGCDDIDNNNICDISHTFYGGQDDYPWKFKDGWFSVLVDMNQYKSDGNIVIDLGSITTESSMDDPSKGVVSFVAEIYDPKRTPARLEVELKQVEEDFDGSDVDIVKSELVPYGEKAVLVSGDLDPDFYKWRARVTDLSGSPLPIIGADGNSSMWYDFGNNGDDADFEVKLVPLYTQRLSDYNYPSSPFDQWANEDYNLGKSNKKGGCGRSIAACGCAITSTVMVMRYHGFTQRDLGSSVMEDVNPKTFNEWLQTHEGYTSANGLDWHGGKIEEYSDNTVAFNNNESYDESSNKLTILNGYLDNNNPMIAYQSDVPYLNSRLETDYTPHFIVIDNKLGLGPDYTYNVKDPSWFGTHTLNDVEDRNNRVKAYGGKFTSLRVLQPYDASLASKDLTVLRGDSPIEFLVTDPNGKKIGKDPVTGIEYNEISGAYYYEEGLGDASGESDGPFHKSKFISIPDTVDGNYDVQVIGTGEGSYTITSNIYDSSGDKHEEVFKGNIRENIITKYTLDYDSTTPASIDVSPDDITPPTTAISITGIQVSGWYSSNVEVSLSATDNSGGVGVWKTEYSLDGGTTWSTYINPFTPPDATNLNILYRSEDYVGNVETYGTTTIDVDQSAPEAEIYFDVVNGGVVINGGDNLSTPTVTKIDDENYTITDHVGHTLKVNLIPTQTSPTLTDPGIANIKPVSLQYNSNDSILLPITDLTYEYSATPVISLNQSITSLPHLSVSGVYNSTDDTTTITGFQGIEAINETLSGVKILKLQTNEGNLEIEY